MTDTEPLSPFDPEFDKPPDRGGGNSRLALIATLLLAVAGFVGVGWFAYNRGFYSASEELAPLVRAEPGDTKRRPEDPGGLEVPHQDKLVFDRLSPGQTPPRVERLLPPPEEPVPRPEAPPVVATAEAPPDLDDAIAALALDEAATEAPQSAPAPLTISPTSAPALPAPSDPEPAPAEVAEATPETPPPAPVETAAVTPPEPEPAPKVEEILPASAPSAGSWRVQLASLGSSEGIEAEWERLQGRHQELLGPLTLRIEKAELSRGTFFRIQAGPLADRAAAQSLCQSLQSRSQDCLVVQP